ncbi:MAG: peptidoglycan DD-metalloendopeptidase family protein [Gammaproteobacteria bacterium]|nr:peptidoglycan DD-metalloendopeptidase family protein [Gammaproteobacteria bacterium]
MRSHIANRTTGIAAALVLAILVGACGGTAPKAPIKEQGLTGRGPEAPTREVRTGDTLYSIAWESGRDYRELAEWNRIAPPYVIRPGQVLRLYPSSGSASRPAPRSEQKPAPKPEASTALDKTARKKSATQKPETASTKPMAAKFGPWSWPADGNVVERFAPNGSNKGIGIAGKKGQAVHAAAPGTVVYQGSGLRGYGELIIIKHDADFLSAYAHNNKVLVKEGNVIRRGQKIAEMGDSGTDRVKLHFEIRHRGTPVDPLAYLPKK